MDIKTALNRIVESLDLTTEEMKSVMRIVMNGEATDAQIGALLMGLRMKSETIDEITGATEVMRELVTGVTVNAEPLVDIVGTGGDGANLFNVSRHPRLSSPLPVLSLPNTATARCRPKAAVPICWSRPAST